MEYLRKSKVLLNIQSVLHFSFYLKTTCTYGHEITSNPMQFFTLLSAGCTIILKSKGSLTPRITFFVSLPLAEYTSEVLYKVVIK